MAPCLECEHQAPEVLTDLSFVYYSGPETDRLPAQTALSSCKLIFTLSTDHCSDPTTLLLQTFLPSSRLCNKIQSCPALVLNSWLPPCCFLTATPSMARTRLGQARHPGLRSKGVPTSGASFHLPEPEGEPHPSPGPASSTPKQLLMVGKQR